MKDSPISWRFNDSILNQLDSKHNSIDHSIELWDAKVSGQYNHLMRIPRHWDEDWNEVNKFSVDTENYSEGRALLLTTEPENIQEVLFFWSRRYSVSVDWFLFVNNWADFCYPDDDTIAIVLNDSRLITFCEEVFTIYEKRITDINVSK